VEVRTHGLERIGGGRKRSNARHIDAPQVVDATDSTASASMACMAAGQLGLEQGRIDLRLWFESASVASLREESP
jgi:hypothetical protein